MKCPYCGSYQLRVDHTDSTYDYTTIRDRKCLSCGRRFKTTEQIEFNPKAASLIMNMEDDGK